MYNKNYNLFSNPQYRHCLAFSAHDIINSILWYIDRHRVLYPLSAEHLILKFGQKINILQELLHKINKNIS